MAEVNPFRAVRYDEDRTGAIDRLVAPPYDVISPEERLGFLDRSPYNVARLIVPDSPERRGSHVARVAPRRRPRRASRSRRSGGSARSTRAPTARGTSARASSGSCTSSRTSAASSAPRAHARGGEALAARAPPRGARPPLADPAALRRPGAAAAPGARAAGRGRPRLRGLRRGTTTRLWRVTDAEALAETQAALADRQLVIADGHHRYETALRFAEEDPAPEAREVMAVFANTDGEGLIIFPTHRVVARAARAERPLPGDAALRRPAGGAGEAR